MHEGRRGGICTMKGKKETNSKQLGTGWKEDTVTVSEEEGAHGAEMNTPELQTSKRILLTA